MVDVIAQCSMLGAKCSINAQCSMLLHALNKGSSQPRGGGDYHRWCERRCERASEWGWNQFHQVEPPSMLAWSCQRTNANTHWEEVTNTEERCKYIWVLISIVFNSCPGERFHIGQVATACYRHQRHHPPEVVLERRTMSDKYLCLCKLCWCWCRGRMASLVPFCKWN